ncbi:MAG: TM2 domain-containing protein [Acutalibacteraceae bacterium]|nr:TM2 domain-containing protein [Acutalibacteraceae bacterium]
MFCKNCGSEIDPNAAVCVKCGFQKGTGNKYCPNCGVEVAEGQAVCVNCGVALKPVVAANGEQKSKLVAVLLALFLGSIGVHDFYLGYTKYGVIKIILAVCTCGIGSSIWAIIDLVRLLTDSLNVDANGVELKREF